MSDRLVYVDGSFVDPADAKISVFDHGLLYGDGAYEGIRAYGGLVFQLHEHVDRLFRSLRSLRLDVSYSPADVADLILETLGRNELEDAYIRVVVTRGLGELGPDPVTCSQPSLIIIALPLPPMHGAEATTLGIRAVIVPTRRDAIDATSHEVKSLNYLNSVVARIEARMAGADEGILLDSRGLICEAPTCNVFVISGARLATPSVASGIVHGITRARIIDLAPGLGLDVQERDITPYELLHAEEVFLAGTHAELVPVSRINDLPVGAGAAGPMTLRLQARFRELTRDPRNGVPISQKEGVR